MTTDPEKATSFLDLPCELRYMIYEFCLVAQDFDGPAGANIPSEENYVRVCSGYKNGFDHSIYSHNVPLSNRTWVAMKRKGFVLEQPSLRTLPQTMAINKLIYQEAAWVYYEKSHFGITSDMYGRPYTKCRSTFLRQIRSLFLAITIVRAGLFLDVLDLEHLKPVLDEAPNLKRLEGLHMYIVSDRLEWTPTIDTIPRVLAEHRFLRKVAENCPQNGMLASGWIMLLAEDQQLPPDVSMKSRNAADLVS